MIFRKLFRTHGAYLYLGSQSKLINKIGEAGGFLLNGFDKNGPPACDNRKRDAGKTRTASQINKHAFGSAFNFIKSRKRVFNMKHKTRLIGNYACKICLLIRFKDKLKMPFKKTLFSLVYLHDIGFQAKALIWEAPPRDEQTLHPRKRSRHADHRQG